MTPYVWVDPPAYSIIDPKPDTSRAYLVDERSVTRVEHANAETRGWADAYVNTHEIGYVFCPREFADVIYIASETLARIDYGVHVPQSMTVYAKQYGNALDELKRTLESVGFYEDKPWDLRPLPNILRRADAKKRIERVVDRLVGYRGPVNIAREAGTVEEGFLNPTRIRDWIRQLPGELAEPALICLEHIKFIDRPLINSVLQSFLGEFSDFCGSSITPIGDAKDGAAVLAYYLGDTAPSFGCEIVPIEQAVAREGPIIFIDDIVGQGSSSISIIESLLGVEPSQDLNEDRPRRLSEAAIGLLRGKPLAFVFAIGLESGKIALERRLEEVGLQAIVYVHERNQALPAVESVLDGKVDSAVAERFVEKCREIGFELLDDGAERHDADWRERRSLGYGIMAF